MLLNCMYGNASRNGTCMPGLPQEVSWLDKTDGGKRKYWSESCVSEVCAGCATALYATELTVRSSQL